MKLLLCVFCLVTMPLRAASLTVIAGSRDAAWPMTFATAINQYKIDRGEPCDVITVKLTTERIAIVAARTTALASSSAIVVLDWSEQWAGHYGTPDIAPAFVSFISGTDPLPGIARPTAIHFIGAGRGASLLSAVAEQLPGTKIDQFTTLDPSIELLDPLIMIPRNVGFADNYYQAQAPAKGTPLTGAYNRQLTFADWRAADAHLLGWYRGTIGDAAADGGYWFIDCPYGARPVDGYNTRRVGNPQVTFVYDALAKVLVQKFAGGTTGVYYWDVSRDLTAWTHTTNSLTFDGRPFRTVPATVSLGDAGQAFFRLRSTL